MVDAIDTMWLMQLQAPYERARNWLVANYAKKRGSVVTRFSLRSPFVLLRSLSAHVFHRDEAMLNLAADVGHA